MVGGLGRLAGAWRKRPWAQSRRFRDIHWLFPLDRLNPTSMPASLMIDHYAAPISSSGEATGRPGKLVTSMMPPSWPARSRLAALDRPRPHGSALGRLRCGPAFSVRGLALHSVALF